MTNTLQRHGWRATGFLAQGFAIIFAYAAQGIVLTLRGINAILAKPLIKVAKWFAYTAAESHINASLLDYTPKTYKR